MKTKRKSNGFRNFVLSSLICSLGINSAYSQTNNTVEEYLNNKTSKLEKINPEEAKKTKNLLENIIYEKSKYLERQEQERKRIEYLKNNKEKRSWDLTEKFLALGYIALNVEDTYQTSRYVGKTIKKGNEIIRFEEKNPFITSWAGKTPSKNEIILFKTLSTAGYLLMCDLVPKYFDNPHAIRKIMLGSADAYQLKISWDNNKVIRFNLKKSF